MAEIIVQEEGGVPTTPASGKWKVYAKSTGLFIIDDAGVETGPFGAAGEGSGDMLKATYDPDNNLIVDEAEATVLQCRKGSAGTINKGQPIYISGYNVSGWIEVELADANDSSKMPVMGFAGESLTSAATGHVHLSGVLKDFDTSAFNVGDHLYISDTAGVLTATRPASTTSLIQIVAHVLRSHATLGAIQIVGAGRHNSLPQFSAADKLWYSDTNGTPAEASITTAGRAIIDDADATAQRATLGLVIGTNVQAYDAELAALAGLTSAADKFPFFTGSGTADLLAIVSAIRTLLASADLDTFKTNLFTAALPENAAIILDAALSADGKYSGIVEAGTAGATLAFGDLCYLAVADSRWELADADAAATAGPVKLGICVLVAAADGSATTMLLFGKVRADAVFPALTIGAPAYVDVTAGDITVTAPSGTTDIVRIVGYANTADELFFCPDTTFIELA